jgi:acyl-CoA synthetase (AMP-forming)/AMP-acid ligase II
MLEAARRGAGLLGDVVTLVRRGVIGPALPHRHLGQVGSILAYGVGLFGELRQAAMVSPARLAVIDEERGERTYGELLSAAETTSEVLRGLGAAPRERVGVLGRNHLATLEAMLAVDALGADLVLLNTGLSAGQLAAVAADQGLTLVVHDDDLAHLVGDLGDVRLVSESELAEEVRRARRPRVVRPARGGRTIVLTSGTTGTPKGATRRTPPGLGPLATILDRIPFNSGERVLISAPIFHTWGYAALQLSLGIRATVVLQRRFDPAATREALERHQVDAHVAVPVMLQRMLELPSDPAARHRRRLRITATSGSALPGGLATAYMNEYGDILYNLYGSTEASWVSIATPGDLRQAPQSSGRPPRGTTVRILDEAGRDVRQGQVGRIFCGNDLVFEGYTSGEGKEFVDGLVSTGDLGYFRDGLLFVEGREDDMIISGGENVYPDEVAAALDRMEGVREAAAVGVPDERFGQRLAVFVVRARGASLTGDAVIAYCKEAVARHAVPRDVHFLDELPRNATGKVLAADLRERAARSG